MIKFYIEDEVSKYKVIQPLGAGAYGKVYIAEKGGFTFAVKEASTEYMYSIYNECSMYSVLNHTNIIKPYKYLFTPDLWYIKIVMPNMEMTLTDLIFNKKYDFDTLKTVFWQVCSATDYMHANNIIHRDLKPDNILIDGIKPYIIDFGLSKYLHPNMVPGSMSTHIQTLDYRAPEVFKNLDYNNKIDVWSLGCILYEMIVHEQLFGEIQDDKSLQSAVCNPQYITTRINSKIKDRNLVQLLLKMLNQDPQLRPSVSEIMKDKYWKGFIWRPPDSINIEQTLGYDIGSPIYEALKKRMKGYLDSSPGITPDVFRYGLSIWAAAREKNPTMASLTQQEDSTLRRIALSIAGYEINEKSFADQDALFGEGIVLELAVTLLIGLNFSYIINPRYADLSQQ